jgi:ATP-dependent RNA helicase DeaD
MQRFNSKRRKREIMKYSESLISNDILKGLEKMGFEDMTPIQEKAIPVMMGGRDVVGQAQTGTGKTAAFGIPMIEAINPADEGVQGLILCPTRELAMQGAEELKKMSHFVKGIKVVAIYGGQDISRQFRELRSNVSIVIGTPGRIMDHMRRGTLKFDHLKMLVLDEADEMLDMGFRDDIETICKAMPAERQTALFSATMPKEIMELTERYQKDAEHIEIEAEELTVKAIKQSYYMVKGNQKDAAICRLIDYMSPKRALIFCNTKRKVDQLTIMLKKKGYSAEALHGDLSQHQRDRVMNLFRSGNLELLLATDVAARGIDVDNVDIVFNYDLPQEQDYYVHRIGRTGRAGKKGRAVTLINTRERRKINQLEEHCQTRIKEKIMPTAVDAMEVKAYSNVSRAIDYCEDMDLKPYKEIIYKRCIDDGVEPLEVAAAFLRESLGELSADVKIEQKPRDSKGGRGRGEDRKEKPAKKRDFRRTEKPAKNREEGHADRDNAKRRIERKSKPRTDGDGGGFEIYRGKHNGKGSKASNKNRRRDSGRSGRR